MSDPGGHQAITEWPFNAAVISRLCSPIKTGASETIFPRLAFAGARIRTISMRKTRQIRLDNMKSNFKTLMIKIMTF